MIFKRRNLPMFHKKGKGGMILEPKDYPMTLEPKRFPMTLDEGTVIPLTVEEY